MNNECLIFKCYNFVVTVPWFTSTMTTRDPQSMGREFKPESRMMAAVENLMDAFKNIGIYDESELKEIEIIIIMRVVDLLSQYTQCNTKLHESNTAKLCDTIANMRSDPTINTPCVTKTSNGDSNSRRQQLSNDLSVFGMNVQPNLVNLINGYQDEI